MTTDAEVEAAAKVLAEQAPYYFADATAKMEAVPNTSALTIARMILTAARQAGGETLADIVRRNDAQRSVLPKHDAYCYGQCIMPELRAAAARQAGDARCGVTGNLCGTDTWAGKPCQCAACQAWLAARQPRSPSADEETLARIIFNHARSLRKDIGEAFLSAARQPRSPSVEEAALALAKATGCGFGSAELGGKPHLILCDDESLAKRERFDKCQCRIGAAAVLALLSDSSEVQRGAE